MAYEIDGVRHDEMPMTQTEFHHAKPVYEFFDGWKTDISGCRTFDDLPKNAQVYVKALEEMSRRAVLGRSASARAASRRIVVHDLTERARSRDDHGPRRPDGSPSPAAPAASAGPRPSRLAAAGARVGDR